MDGAYAHVAREARGETTMVMQLGTVDNCDPSRMGSDAYYSCYGRNHVVEEEDGSRGKSKGSWSGRQQWCGRCQNSGFEANDCCSEDGGKLQKGGRVDGVVGGYDLRLGGSTR
ncbi:hypothetical protein B296_00009808 [Ensete ventricosum]|uniref:Uncharacterized protein n=1 Tax=Ensete ventricosum TaxID=4639 RepID=A0A427ALF4_ENSVE|nr:hypothetical protein B296_00009808 [Ensete ventricosum]